MAGQSVWELLWVATLSYILHMNVRTRDKCFMKWSWLFLSKRRKKCVFPSGKERVDMWWCS